MSSLTDVILEFKAKDQVSNVTNKIGSSISGLSGRMGGMGSMLGSAFITASGYMSNFARDCVNSAMTAETELEPVRSSSKSWRSQSEANNQTK